jgi:hypothetical protein
MGVVPLKYNYIMLDIKYTEFLNEDMAAISSRKLRDAMHDIIVDLEPKETIDVEELSNTLMADHKITISPFFLDKFLDDFLRVKRGDRRAKTFFTRADTRWLGVRDVKGTKEIRNNLNHLKPALTKHKRRLFELEDKKRLDDAYKAGMKDLSFSEDVIKKSLILQKPEDSADIMKIIYSDVIFNKKYENTYDNCWKLMMLIGRGNKLDRVRHWFKLAPQSVKDEYMKGEEGHRRINYDLTRPPATAKTAAKKINPNRDLDIPPETKANLEKVDTYLNKYKSWGAFIKDTTLRQLIGLIDELEARTSTDTDIQLNQFLAKIDQLNLILIKFYRVERRDIIMFYRNIGLAGYLREWETMHKRPKINDF